MNKQDILTLFEYNRWATGRTLDAAEKLDAKPSSKICATVSHPFATR